jgi:hypothetical protein
MEIVAIASLFVGHTHKLTATVAKSPISMSLFDALFATNSPLAG